MVVASVGLLLAFAIVYRFSSNDYFNPLFWGTISLGWGLLGWVLFGGFFAGMGGIIGAYATMYIANCRRER